MTHVLLVVAFSRLIWFQIETDTTKPFTHLIVCKNLRSLKVLFACARGVELIDTEWMFACIEAGGWVEPMGHVSSMFTSKTASAGKAKTNAKKNKKGAKKTKTTKRFVVATTQHRSVSTW